MTSLKRVSSARILIAPCAQQIPYPKGTPISWHFNSTVATMSRCFAITLVFALASYGNADELDSSFALPQRAQAESRDRDANSPISDRDRFLDPATETEPRTDGDFPRLSDSRLSQQSRDVQGMLQRIEQLERKVAALEAHQAASRYPQPNAPIPPNNHSYPNQLYEPSPQRIQPSPRDQSSPRDQLGPRVQAGPTPGASPNWYVPPSSRTLPPSSDPQNRQRFNFNGQWFYIIPVEDTAR